MAGLKITPTNFLSVCLNNKGSHIPLYLLYKVLTLSRKSSGVSGCTNNSILKFLLKNIASKNKKLKMNYMTDINKKNIQNIYTSQNKKIKSDYKRGWGMQLMEQLMDSVEVLRDENGCTIVLTKRRN